jgi:hypothetical protein
MQKLIQRFGAIRRAVLLPVAGAATVLALPAHAAIDVSAATSGIADAQTALLAVLAAMLTLGVAVWGVKKVVRFFGR